ncbi:hypothetical protein [Schlesneria paludicola]|uniref:hypothetical protein n=1 Tax=Schlesneria paludicola TaxID=360056 RepID=UPI00029B50E1|nr:hypothetical protein [Schlesneria paludicola]
MFQRLVFTLATAVSLTGLYALYTLAMRPIVVIPIAPEQNIENHERAEDELPSDTNRVAESYLPRKKWAANAQHTLRVDQAYIYTDDWKPDEENSKKIQFSPFAMVWLTTGEDGKEAAYSISSDSAQLEFASNLDIKSVSTTPGRVVRARLIGDVNILGPNGLEINGRGFIFDEESLMLQTFNPVTFRFQSNEGSASRMEMKLIAGEGKPTLDRPHISGVESIRLIAAPNGNSPKNHLVSLKVFLPPEQAQYSPVIIRCASDMVYSFRTNTAVLSKDVRAWSVKKKSAEEMRDKRDRPDNWLTCETLTMKFRPRKSPVVNNSGKSEPDVFIAPTSDPGYQKPETDLEFNSFSAEGPLVIVNSTSQGVQAKMTSLSYNADARIVAMTSLNSQRAVEVQRKDSRLLSPEIEARLSEANELESLVCLGAGKLEFFDENTLHPTMTANWEKRLRKSFDPATQFDLIELDEKAQFVQYGERFGLGAEQIKIWLAPIKMGIASMNANQNQSSTMPNPEPKRMFATGDVALRHPQMELNTRELDVIFDEPVRASSARRDRESRNQLRLAGFTAKRSEIAKRNPPPRAAPTTAPNRGPYRQAFANVPIESDRSLGPAVDIPFDSATIPAPPRATTKKNNFDSQEPWEVSADRIEGHVRLIPGTQKFEHLVVHCSGKDVQVARKSESSNEKPLRIIGQQIELEAESEQNVIAHVLGEPAQIADERFTIEGHDIHLDRAANLARVEGKGRLWLPVPADAKLPGLDDATSRELEVRWKESMKFDGLNARFYGTIVAKLGFAKMHCEQMGVQLTKRLSFQDAQLESTPEINLIRCQDKVWFEHAIYAKNKQTDVFRGDVGEFVLRLATGAVEATGPGNVYAWRRKQIDSGISARETIQANRPIPTEVTTWDYTHVKFNGQLMGTFSGLNQGESNRQSVTIEERVEVTYGPVESPNERVDPDHLPSMAGNMHCHRLEVINREGADRSSTKNLELIGRGNAEVEGQVNGQSFTASADEIIYDGSKGFFILRARGRQNARVTGIGAGRQGGQGQEIHFNPDPKHQILRVDRASSGQISQ